MKRRALKLRLAARAALLLALFWAVAAGSLSEVHLSWASDASAQQDQRPIPALSGPVIDEAGMLSAREAQQLEEELRAYSEVAQIQVWTITTLGAEPIESLSIRATNKWKLGDAKKDNGVLILVAAQEHRARIEVGQGLEGNLPDALAGRIIDQVLKPRFRRQAYYEGLSETAKLVYEAAGGQDIPIPRDSRSHGGDELPNWVIYLIVAFIILRFLGGWWWPGFFGGFGGGRWGGGGGGWGGRGGGGGWSGGGGGFSGGGASGDW